MVMATIGKGSTVPQRAVHELTFVARPTTDPAQVHITWKVKQGGRIVLFRGEHAIRTAEDLHDICSGVVWDWLTALVAPNTLAMGENTAPA